MRKPTLVDAVGLVFGQLTILEELPREGSARWVMALCACGQKRKLRLANLRCGNTRSCGCLGMRYRGSKKKVAS